MRWHGQSITTEDQAALPGLEQRSGLVRSVTTPEFAGITFHEVLARSVLNRVPGTSRMPFNWTINPYRGCSHACVYCFARGTHEYLDFDGGGDFDTQVVVKINTAEVLRRELQKPSWKRQTVALGTNTDPYQRAEGRYRLMPDIITTLADSGTPISILTKGTLIKRDLPLLQSASRQVPVDVSFSIAMFDDTLQRSIEPGTPSTQARLDTVRAFADAGLRVGVFLMPILPHLSDSVEALDTALSRIAAAGADSIVYGALHLRPGVKPWFVKWLRREHPELVSSYAALYPADASHAPKDYRRWLSRRVLPLARMHGLSSTEDDDVPQIAPARASPALARPAGGHLRTTGPRSDIAATTPGVRFAASAPAVLF